MAQVSNKRKKSVHDFLKDLNDMHRIYIIQQEFETWEMIDHAVIYMDEYPDAQYIIDRIRENIRNENL